MGLFLVVIWLVAGGDPFALKLGPAFAVNVSCHRSNWRKGITRSFQSAPEAYQIVSKPTVTGMAHSHVHEGRGRCILGNFLVRVSLDGDKAIHDFLRPDAGGKDTWNRVTKNLALLRREKVEVNLLCVVSRQCAKHPQKVYRSLQELGGYLQFIPCLDPLEAERGSMPYSLTPELYGDFLCALFDEWYRDLTDGKYVSIRLFDDYVHLAMGLPAGTCSTAGTCGAYFVVEGDGSLYPCDFYCLDEWKLGRLGDAPLPELAGGETAQKFLAEGLEHPAECASCPWVRLCSGGCKRDWIRTGEGNHNYFCPAFRQFFAYAGDRIARAQQGAF